MHNLFADWYRQVDLDASADRLTARWGCVEAAVAALDADAIAQLTRVCFGLPKPGIGPGNDGVAITQIFKEVDVSFPMKGNEQLLRVLYGATLAECIENGGALATCASLAVSCAHCFGLVAGSAVAELVPIAEAHLTTQGAERRDSGLEAPVAGPAYGKVEVVQPTPVEMVETSNPNQWANVQQNFQRLASWMTQASAALGSLTKAVAETRSETASAFEANADRVAPEIRIAVLKEECNVLWWLFGEYSESVSRHWQDGRASELCVVLGRDLAKLMCFEEPTPNARSFLLKALSRTASNQETLTAKEILDDCDEDWRTAAAEELREVVGRGGAVTPLHTGIVHRADSATRWADLFTQTTGLSPEQALTPVEWAEQAYREALLLAAWENKRG